MSPYLHSRRNQYTVESVLSGHPDKVCDQICDALLDAYLEQDEDSRVGVECLGTNGHLVVGGEVRSRAEIDVAEVARGTYRGIGYKDELAVLIKLQSQSRQLGRVIDHGDAGDQGVMYGYACADEPHYLPTGVCLVHAIAREIDLLRKDTFQYGPDGKVQVTFADGRVDTLVISVQQQDTWETEELRCFILEGAVSKLLAPKDVRRILFNHKSEFVDGGFWQ